MKLRTMLLALTIASASFGASASGEAEYKYREGVMKAVGGHMSSIGAIMRGRVHSDNLGAHARALAELALIAPEVFPAGSGVDKSEALPVIWEKPEAFKSATDRFIKASREFAAAVESDGDVGGTLRALGGSCKGCHDDFREDH